MEKKQKIAIIMHGARFLKNFISYKNRSDVDQILLVPREVEHKRFGISDVKIYDAREQIDRYLRKFKPNFCIQASTDFTNYRYFLKTKVRKVFVSPGMYADSDEVRRILFRERKKFKIFDLIFVASEREKELFECMRIPEKKIRAVSLPQFDLLGKDRYHEYRTSLLSQLKFVPEKIILFAGDRYSNSADVRRVRDNYDTILKLSEIVRHRNWLVLIKPKSNNMLEFIERDSLGFSEGYIRKFHNALKNDHVVVLKFSDWFYPYFFADVIIDNGGSTVAIEACLANRPSISISERQSFAEMDSHGVLGSDASFYLSDMLDLLKCIYEANYTSDIGMAQNNFLDKIGLVKSPESSNGLIDAILKEYGV